VAGFVDAPGEVVLGIETDRGLWLHALAAAGYEVYANPLGTRHASHPFRLPERAFPDLGECRDAVPGLQAARRSGGGWH
jgi:hypothetical protein